MGKWTGEKIDIIKHQERTVLYNSVLKWENTYGKIYAITSNSLTKLHIGNYCSIGPNVIFIMSGGHTIENISTYPFKVYCLNQESEGIVVPDIYIYA